MEFMLIKYIFTVATNMFPFPGSRGKFYTADPGPAVRMTVQITCPKTSEYTVVFDCVSNNSL